MNPKKNLTYLISQGNLTSQNYSEKKRDVLALFKKAFKANLSLIQIREKSLAAGLLTQLAKATLELRGEANTKVLINDRLDIALATGADGVHLTSTSMPASVIRRISPSDFVIAVSCHSTEEITRAQQDGADFVCYSPIFTVPSKAHYGEPRGLKGLNAAVAKAKGFPVIALGGINEGNFRQVLKAGASGIAAIRFFSEADDLTRIAENVMSCNDEN